MGYGKRIDTLCSLLTQADVFADVGCDHGYCTEYMLKNNLCKHAIFSDVSKGSLAKAEELLADYVQDGRATAVLGDGFFGVPSDVGQVLIAGMGGSEIVSILSDKRYGFMPKRFVFQPMHDGEKLRRYILKNGGYIERDFTFADGKFYDVIVGRKSDEEQSYTDAELEFGKENILLRGQDFMLRIEKLKNSLNACLNTPSLQEESRRDLQARIARLEGVLRGEIK